LKKRRKKKKKKKKNPPPPLFRAGPKATALRIPSTD
jgi:hypothetical protein